MAGYLTVKVIGIIQAQLAANPPSFDFFAYCKVIPAYTILYINETKPHNYGLTPDTLRYTLLVKLNSTKAL